MQNQSHWKEWLCPGLQTPKLKTAENISCIPYGPGTEAEELAVQSQEAIGVTMDTAGRG